MHSMYFLVDLSQGQMLACLSFNIGWLSRWQRVLLHIWRILRPKQRWTQWSNLLGIFQERNRTWWLVLLPKPEILNKCPKQSGMRVGDCGWQACFYFDPRIDSDTSPEGSWQNVETCLPWVAKRPLLQLHFVYLTTFFTFLLTQMDSLVFSKVNCPGPCIPSVAMQYMAVTWPCLSQRSARVFQRPKVRRDRNSASGALASLSPQKTYFNIFHMFSNSFHSFYIWSISLTLR